MSEVQYFHMVVEVKRITIKPLYSTRNPPPGEGLEPIALNLRKFEDIVLGWIEKGLIDPQAVEISK